MNRDHQPCGTCSRFLPTGAQKAHEEGPGHCEGFERPAHSTDRPCVLFVEQGSREARLGAKDDRQLLAEFQRRGSRKAETISRASA